MIPQRHSQIGTLTFLLGSTIGFAAVGAASLSIFPILRIMFLAVSALSIFTYFQHSKVTLPFLVALGFIAIFFAFGLINSSLFGLDVYPTNDILQSFIISIVGVHFFTTTTKLNIEDALPLRFSLLSLLIVLFFIFVGELRFSGLPHFVYEILTDDGTQVLYSQGTSAFFGISAIGTILVARHRGGFIRTLWTAIFFLFFFLSFIGGGRGEFIFLIIILFFAVAKRGNAGIIFLITSFPLIIYFFDIVDVSTFSELRSVLRFLSILENSDYGLRDLLFAQSISLLLDDPRCFIAGCGYGYFQDYYGYRSSLYPHNIVLEGMIVWGVPAFSLLLIVAFFGWLKSPKRHFLSIVGLYFFAIGLKSGSVISSWLALSFLFSYAGIGVSFLLRERLKNLPLLA